jgi:glycine/D-amino acid oxidase-like deaminating enzyme
MKNLASELFGKEVIKDVSNLWAGLRPCTPDDNPILGQLKY